MQIYDSIFLTINLPLGYIELIWKAQTEKATAEQFKAWNKIITDAVDEHKPVNMLADCTNYFFMITPDLQEWSVENVFNRFEEAGLQKLAMIMSTEMIAQLSLEQFVDEAQTNLVTRYFDKPEAGKKWFL
jgi:hypothetical protein